MEIDGSRAWRKLGILSAICLVATLGDLRGSGSQAIASPGLQGDAVLRAVSAADASPDVGGAAKMIGVDADGPSGSSTVTETKDEVHLVPAIYAWDPDVRFIYFRHVSKWM